MVRQLWPCAIWHNSPEGLGISPDGGTKRQTGGYLRVLFLCSRSKEAGVCILQFTFIIGWEAVLGALIPPRPESQLASCVRRLWAGWGRCTGVWENSGADTTRLTAEGRWARHSSHLLLCVPHHSTGIRAIWGTGGVGFLPPSFNYCQKYSLQHSNSPVTLETKVQFLGLLYLTGGYNHTIWL